MRDAVSFAAVDHGEPFPCLAGPAAEQPQGREPGVVDLVDVRKVNDELVVSRSRQQESTEERRSDATV